MEYGRLIHQAWTLTWRFRFLWLLSVVAGGAVGVPTVSWQTQANEVPPPVQAIAEQLSDWAAMHTGLLVGLAVLAALLLLVLVVLSLIAQGGMARATADLAEGRQSSLARAWSAGVHLFWRYASLWLLCAAVALVVAALMAAVVIPIVSSLAGDYPPLIGGSIAVAAGLVVFVGLVVVSIVVAFAQRAIAVENVGPLVAIRLGWNLARAHVGETLLAWLINTGLALASGVLAILGLIAVVAVVAGVGALVFGGVGLSAPLLAYVGFGALALMVGGLTVVGIANTFFWYYWTLAYFRLTRHTVSAALS